MVTKPNGDDRRYIDGTINNVGKNDNNRGYANDDDHDHAIDGYTRVKTHKLLQVCKQVVTSLFTSCQQVVFALLVPSLL